MDDDDGVEDIEGVEFSRALSDIHDQLGMSRPQYLI
jgi:hypothetical protein